MNTYIKVIKNNEEINIYRWHQTNKLYTERQDRVSVRILCSIDMKRRELLRNRVIKTVSELKKNTWEFRSEDKAARFSGVAYRKKHATEIRRYTPERLVTLANCISYCVTTLAHND